MSRDKGHTPVRTCISCRKKGSKMELTRLVLDSRGVVVCDDATGEGRGAYVCSKPSCWENLGKGKRLNRAFRKDGPIAICADLKRQISNKGIHLGRGEIAVFLQAQPTE